MMGEKSKVTITTFSDPMMGLSYECEPIFRKLETHFPDAISYEYVMSGLVRNVYDFVDPADLPKGKDIAIKNYNVRLAEIYESEEPIMGMPINMTDFHLFSVENTSSIPLNLAYKAVELADAGKAGRFLYNLRYATIVDSRPTTHREEILDVVRKTGIREDVFCRYFDGGAAQTALEGDWAFMQEMGIHSLPSYLVEYHEKKLLIQSLIGYSAFVSILNELTEGKLKPQRVTSSLEQLDKLLNKHPLISPIEIREAFDLSDLEEVRSLVQPLLDAGTARIREVHHGWFIEKMNVEGEV